ncbi:outer membrane protein assembly factor BamC [Methylomonas sp. SURF-1]|uniref:Outer membrane protein assembly factor BamC n=1 Tax=Methylomonas aurea TaxID=2952224 RepID=A0ABT1UCX9_9GAMM|nr:outer membrane protein assembly factor BamC [Methylomonas sp. SURF-1]MCQ8180075.1 outer membrane protein assembly factor BamC [Methylomonas sp. SURF-1]
MKSAKFPRLALAGALACGLPACSYVKSWFPDKERDYQFTNEIPELVIPEDLKQKTLATRPAAKSAPTTTAEAAAAANVEPAPAKTEDQVSQSRSSSNAVASAEAAAPAPNQRPAGTPGVSSLQIDQSAQQAWWLVGKALSRQKLEVVERNVDKRYFFVKYDPNAMKPEDGSFLDEINFLFGDDPSRELEYRISVSELDAQSAEVTVQDEAGTTLSNDVATSLLRLITDGIKQDLSAEPTEAPAEK